MRVLYTTTVTSHGPRSGRATATDGRLDLELAVPTELGGSGAGTDPEQLFAAGYSACFHAALTRVAKAKGYRLVGSEVVAEVSLLALEEGRFGISVLLRARVPGVPDDEARELMDQAHQVCPYSNATRGNVDVQLELAQGAERVA